MLATVASALPLLLQRTAGFQTGAPHGTGLEWMTVGSVVVPALLLILFVYLGTEQTV